jgi:uncharacterized protein (TIRG00374 family)
MRGGLVIEPMSEKWLRAITLSTVLAAAAYLVIVLWAGRAAVLAAINRVGVETVLILFGLSLTNYGLRFVRWHYYLRKLRSDIGVFHDLRIYIAGFALTTTPGKAGELARTLWLRPYGVPANRSIAAFFAERILDFIAILALSCIGLSAYQNGRWLLLVGVLLVLAAMAMLFVPALTRLAIRLSGRTNRRIAALARSITNILMHTRGVLTLRPLVVGLIIGVVAWSAECSAFAMLMEALGHRLAIATAFSIYAFSMLAGAISFMPGGLGGSEATMIILLSLSGVPVSIAVSGTVLIRLATLWFAVLLGIVALAIRVNIPASAASMPPAASVEASE